MFIRLCNLFLALLLATGPAFADAITLPYSYSPGQVITAAKLNANNQAITDQVNGNLSDANIKVGAAIAPTKIDFTQGCAILRAAAANGLTVGTTGDTVPRLAITSEGAIHFGPGGGTARDIQIMRKAGPVIAIRNEADSADGNITAGALTLSTPLSGINGGLGNAITPAVGTLLVGDGTKFVSIGPGSSGQVPLSNGTTIAMGTPAAGVVKTTCNGRLTLTSGLAVTTSNVTAATNVYFTPFQGNEIALYDGSSAWNSRTFTEITISLSGLTANKNYDIFLYDNAGTVTARSPVIWTTDSARATALTTQDGVLVKTGATTDRYVGTIRITGTTGQTEDSTSRRYVSNYYNRKARSLQAVDTTDNWTYSTTTFRQFNNSTTDGVGQVSLVVGVSEDLITATANAASTCSGGSTDAAVGIGIDSSTVSSAVLKRTGSTGAGSTRYTDEVTYKGYLAAGKHTIAPLEKGSTSPTTTWYGDNGSGDFQTGLIAEVMN